MRIKVGSVVFREDLYPRFAGDPATVQRYAADLSVLPPIEVNQHNELIDGWHRWTAHRKNEADEIDAVVTETASDSDLLEKAIERNATHGLQLSAADKKRMAIRIYLGADDREEKKRTLCKILSVSERTVRDWLADIDAASRKERSEKIFDLWMACHTQEEIAEAIGEEQKSVSREMQGFSQNGSFAEMTKTQDFDRDFDPPIYNVWSFGKKSNDVSHFGNSEQRIVENLLWMFTDPLKVVVDPFAGGGSTIDICKRRMRRYFVSDRKPIVEREKEIRKHDVVSDGILKPPEWNQVQLVYLDPPYWRQAAGQYSDDPTDLGNVCVEDFHSALVSLVKDYLAKIPPGAAVALLVQPTQWLSDDRQFADHVCEVIRGVKQRPWLRVSCPYQTEQYNAQQVEWAKANKTPLVLTRELIIWKGKA